MLSLAFGHAFKLHMHLQHNHDPSSTLSAQKLDVHISSSFHDATHNTYHQDDFQDHHLADIKVSPDSAVKKVETFTPFMVLLLFISLFLAIPPLRSIFTRQLQTKLSSTYYLLSPPLRAPPILFPV